ncbi:hypothetical protein MMC20_003344 [Loxospora ochrophaea]|nr:hypothetical protein [Loxospora ochrophaea]
MTSPIINQHQSTDGDGRKAMGRKQAECADRIKFVDGNVWEWIHEIAAASPVQPIANLGTGFIEYNPPDFIIDAHKKALNAIKGNQYAPITGLPVLKQAISNAYSPFYGKTLDAEKEISVHSGAQEGLLSCMMAFIQPGDEVILLEPVFELYVYQTKFAGGIPRYVPLRAPETAASSTVSGNDWTLDMHELEQAITPKTKMLILNNPHNPLGKVFTTTELHSISQLCTSHDLIILSDEVYERIAFTSPFPRIATLSPAIASRTLTSVSLGKLFNATGWRVGFVIGPWDLLKHVQAAHLILAYASSSAAQEAAAVGLRTADLTGWWDVNKRDVQMRVTSICDVLDEIGLTYVAPAGAYFIFVNIARLILPADYPFPAFITTHHASKDWKVCFYLVNEIGVSSIPGTCFYGPEHANLGYSYVRLGACKSDQGLEMARERLRKLKALVV